jgi:hypothetical protein
MIMADLVVEFVVAAEVITMVVVVMIIMIIKIEIYNI